MSRRKRTTYTESPTARNRRCRSCDRGMAMVRYDGGRFCQYCGYDPADAAVWDMDPHVASPQPKIGG